MAQKTWSSCAQGKQTKGSFKPNHEVSTSRPIDLIHTDLCGPVKVQSRGGKRYIIVVVDDYSRYTWVRFLRSKAEAAELLINLINQIQNQFGSKVAGIMSDHGTEFENSTLDGFCAENGIHQNFSAPRTPQQNGVVKRKHRTLVEIGRTMLIDSGLIKISGLRLSILPDISLTSV